MEHFEIIYRDNRNEELENKFNLHINKPYRVQVITAVYDGIMTDVRIHIDEKGKFFPVEIRLENGFLYDVRDSREKILFNEQIFMHGDIRYLYVFGRILDEEGFDRVRNRLLGGKN